jgi:hypothetical protein
MNVAMLMTESVDNFISSTRNDFVDPRYRAVSLADLFPEGYRRWLANALTGDELLKGVRVVADEDGDTLPDNDLDGDTVPDWPLLRFASGTGRPIVRWDPGFRYVAPDGSEHPEGIPGCNATENYACTCTSNRACMLLQRYLTIPAYLREAVYAYQLGDPERRGVWDRGEGG